MERYPKKLNIEFEANTAIISGTSITDGLSLAWEEFNGKLPDEIHKFKEFEINFKLYAYNTGTSAYITRTLYLAVQNSINTKVTINWYYDLEEEDMEDAGLMYKQICNQFIKEINGLTKIEFKLKNYE